VKKINQKTEKIYTTLDAYQAGWLTLKGHTPQFIDQQGKIVFVFNLKESLIKDLAAYNSGGLIEASRFAFAIKTLKSQIHSMRRGKEEICVKEQKQ
jgi:hypothetical protein